MLSIERTFRIIPRSDWTVHRQSHHVESQLTDAERLSVSPFENPWRDPALSPGGRMRPEEASLARAAYFATFQVVD